MMNVLTNKLDEEFFSFWMNYSQERLILKEEPIEFRFRKYQLRKRAIENRKLDLGDLTCSWRMIEIADVIFFLNKDQEMIKLKDRWYGKEEYI